jgi:hypothetical protein
MSDLKFTEYEDGQRQILIDLRSVLLVNPSPKLKEIDAWAAQVLHDITMSAKGRSEKDADDDGFDYSTQTGSAIDSPTSIQHDNSKYTP